MARTKASIILVLLSVRALCGTSAAEASDYLFCAVGWHGEFTIIEPGTPESAPTRTDLPRYLQALAWSPNGTLFAGRENDLYTLNPWTGDVNHFLSTRTDIRGMAFAPSGELYVTSEHTSAQLLHVIDLETGEHTEVGSLWGDGKTAQGLAFSPEGVLYAISPKVHIGTYELFTVEPGNGHMHLLGSFASSANANQSIAFTPDGRLYALGADILVQLNPADGTIIGSPTTLSGEYRGLELVRGPKTVYYVDDDAPGANDGSSWHNAFNHLQDAVAAVEPYTEIRVGQGTYRPDLGAGITLGNRKATFQLKNRVTIKGGYAGFDAPDPDAREVDIHQTILSGDLNGDDGLDFTNYGDNSHHVVTAGGGTNATAVLDGVTITAGNADGSYPGGRGAGLYTYAGSPTISNCTFLLNRAQGSNAGGAGLWNYRGNPSILHCAFRGNLVEGAPEYSSIGGAGLWNYEGNPKVEYCTFTDNLAEGPPEYCAVAGGGLWNYEGAPTVTNCTFTSNSTKSEADYADLKAGAMYNYSGSPTVSNCLFVGNTTDGEGAALWNYEGTPVVTNCTFSANVAEKSGGAFWNYEGAARLTNCILWDNAPAEIHNYVGTVATTFCNIQGGSAGQGNIDANPLFDDPDKGDYHLLSSSPCINAGDPDYAAGPGETDLDGGPRVLDGRVDIGAYESHPPAVLYVDADSPGANDGSSWHDAFNHLQDALATVEPGTEIRIGQGTYTPDLGAGITPGNRNASFELKNAVTIKGGYSGWYTTDPNERDTSRYETVLSGDIHRDDGPDFANNDENSYHVVTGTGADGTAILDGFTITGGNTMGAPQNCGAGMYTDEGNPVVIDCVFRHNAAIYFPGGGGRGGGLYNRNSDLTLIGCTINANIATRGGGIYNNGLTVRPELLEDAFRQYRTPVVARYLQQAYDLYGIKEKGISIDGLLPRKKL